MAKRKIIKNYEGKKKGEQGSIFVYKGKIKTTYGFILELPQSANGERNRIEKGGFDSEWAAVITKRNMEQSSGSNTRKSLEIITLHDFFNNVFLKYQKNNGRAYSTIRGYIANFNDAYSYFGDIDLIQIKRKDFEGYKNYLLSQNKFKNSTINEKLNQVKYILDVATELEYLEVNKFNGKNLLQDKDKKEPYSNQDLNNIFSIIETNKYVSDNNKYYIPCYIALNTGARLGEILALKWEDVDFKDKYISINKNLTLGEHQSFILGPTKTKEDRIVPLNANLEKELKKHKLRQKQNKLKFGPNYVDSDFICTYSDGRLVTHNTMSSLSSLFSNRSIDFNFHRFRHTFASRAVAVNIHVKVLQEILGHADIATTMEYYASVDNKQMLEAADIISDSFSL